MGMLVEPGDLRLPLGRQQILSFFKKNSRTRHLAFKIKSLPFLLGQRLCIKIYATTGKFSLMPAYINLIHRHTKKK